jgi:hypothetical protein
MTLFYPFVLNLTEDIEGDCDVIDMYLALSEVHPDSNVVVEI